MNLFRHLARAAAVTLATVLCFANAFAADADSGTPQDYLLSHYRLQVILQVGDSASGNLRLGALADPAHTGDYLSALVTECKKYPDAFFSKAGVSEIVLCGDLHMGQAPIAGLFDAREKRLYVKYHWCKYEARCRMTFHAFHHELGHALQTASWGDGHYPWPAWTAANPPAFQYGGGGSEELMADPDKNWGTWTTNQPGFLNPYSTTAPWEDRSEIMAAIMNNGDRWCLKPYFTRDPILRKKVELMAGLLSSFCGPTPSSYYWERALRGLKAPPAVARQTNPNPQPVASVQSNPPPSSVPTDLKTALGGNLIDAGGNPVSFDALKDKKYFLLYFSASWCSHCRAFMPQFVDFYQNSKSRDQFEVLFVSSDRNELEMLSYLHEMPWLGVRLDSAAESYLKSNYSRGPGIPGLVLIDRDGHLLSIRKGFDKVLDALNQKLVGNE